MARIRIVDDWLRSPASPPTHYRSIMVVADGWAEQRVLMRAYAESVDQTRPTIVLHGQELAIGPAGTDPHGNWGIHVQPPVDGRAQELKDQLELAARRIAGSKGTPPRLADESSPFERKVTNPWAPGSPRDVPGAGQSGYYEPAVAASQVAVPTAGATARTMMPQPAPYLPPQPAQYVPQQQPAQYVPQQQPAQVVGASAPPMAVASAPVNPGERMTPLPMQTPAAGRRRGWTSPIPLAAAAPASAGAEVGARTALGYDSGAGAQNAVIRLGLRPRAAAQLARLVDRTVPADFAITPHERDVINALGEHGQLTARQIGQMIGVADPVTWMERLVGKLASYGLDVVGPGTPQGSEPTYVLRR